MNENSKGQILLAEDDLNLGFLTMESLEAEGYSVKLCKDGTSAIAALKSHRFDLYILDVMMPNKDGFQVAEAIRAGDKETPIIFLTARSMKEDKLKGFNLGADDYITKPFEEEELIARVEAILRRSKKVETAKGTIYQIGNYSFDPGKQQLTIEEELKRMTERESLILEFLAERKNEIVKREELLNKVWGKNDYFLGRSLDVFITKLRKYLKNDAQVSIENIHGVGFMLKDS